MILIGQFNRYSAVGVLSSTNRVTSFACANKTYKETTQ